MKVSNGRATGDDSRAAATCSKGCKQHAMPIRCSAVPARADRAAAGRPATTIAPTRDAARRQPCAT